MGGAVFKEGPYQAERKIDDENTETVTVDETNILWEIVDKGLKGSYPSGIWLGGVKHTLVREQELEVEGQNVMMRVLGRQHCVGLLRRGQGPEERNRDQRLPEIC